MLQSFFTNIPENVLNKIQNLNLNVRSENCSVEIDKVLGNSVLVGGKRLRPLLTYVIGDMLGINLDDIHVLGKSIELVHAASLAHDDVVDEATSRRGRPSINAMTSNKHAVLAGDYLLADVIVELSKLQRIELVIEMSRIIKDLAVGEWIQLDAIESRQYTRDLILDIAMKKTASVMSWCCFSPAVFACLPQEAIESLKSMGIHLGLAFQQIDDALDFSKDGQKDHLIDLKNGIVNSVIYEWLELNPEIKARFESGEDLTDIWNGANIESAVLTVKECANEHLVKAEEYLKKAVEFMPNNENVNISPVQTIIKFLGSRNI